MNNFHNHQLLGACTTLDAIHVDSFIRDLQSSSPSYSPQVSLMLETAAFYDNADGASYCLTLGALFTDSVMSETIRGHSFATYKVFVSHALNSDRIVPSFDDILANVCLAGEISWARFCLDNGADPNFHTIDDPMYLLAATAELSTVEMADLLLQHGARMEGSGAIVIAAEKGRINMVKFLLEKGADIDEIGLMDFMIGRAADDGGSALHKAVTEKRQGVVRYLLEKGANVNLMDIKDRTPLMRARENGSDTITNLLETYGATE